MEIPDILEGPICIDTETYDPYLKTRGGGWAFKNKKEFSVVGVAISADNWTGYLPLFHGGGDNVSNPPMVIEWLKWNLANNPHPKIFANALYDIGGLLKLGVKVNGPIEDVQIQAPLLDENRLKYDLSSLTQDYLGKEGKRMDKLIEANYLIGGEPKSVMLNLWRFPGSTVEEYAVGDVVDTKELWHYFNKKIKDEELEGVYRLECDLLPVLLDMRLRGVRIDLDAARKAIPIIQQEEEKLIQEIKDITGKRISPTMNSEIAEALKNVGMILPKTPKTDKDSIRAEWLEEQEHPVCQKIVELRQIHRARSTFIEKFLLDKHEDGRIHTTFNSLKNDDGKGTLGGRFSSSGPNLQQIPARNERMMKLCRSLFLPEEGDKWGSLDYSSQEPRWTCHFAAAARVKGGEEAAERYRNDPKTDYHQMVADITGLPRKFAKILNLGIAYGMGGAKLCHSLGLPTVWREIYGKMVEVAGEEGERILKTYDERAPFIKGLNKMCKNTANSRGYIKTYLGRRCRFPMVGGKRMFVHKAMNRLIQGSSADQTKRSLIELHKVLPQTLLVTVHDENCLSLPGEKEAKIAQEIMENCIPNLLVPFLCEPKLGNNWGECK